MKMTRSTESIGFTAVTAVTVLASIVAAVLAMSATAIAENGKEKGLDERLKRMLDQQGFTGNIEMTLEEKLGRPLEPDLIELGRDLFFDEIMSLHNDNACAGCHAPAFGFGDPGSVAYGVDNNRIVGPNRDGTRNERKAPILTNVAFFPTLMLNGRFEARSGNPFDNSEGFRFPPPNGDTKFGPGDPNIPTLLTAQAFLPVPSLTEMAGFTGTSEFLDPRFHQFDDGHGTPIPPPDATGNIQPGIRLEVLRRLDEIPEYRKRFGEIFNGGEPFAPGEIPADEHSGFAMVGQAMAEFQMALLAANAPIDRFARGETEAMTDAQKRGALLFFGKAKCVQCHAVSGRSRFGDANEMFSDFDIHNIGVPPVHPLFGAGSSNALLDGPEFNEDFGRFRITGDPADLYGFRTSPIRNVAVQRAFFHNGCFTRLEDAILHHLYPVLSALSYDPEVAGIDEDLHNIGPIEPILMNLDPILANPIHLNEREFSDLLEFVRDGLLDPKALPENLCTLVPDSVPSLLPLPLFEGCKD